jgi:hypothetical protein
MLSDISNLDTSELIRQINTLFLLSESRGKEAAGLAVVINGSVHVYKESSSASKMIGSKRYKTFMRDLLEKDSSDGAGKSLTLIGHSRLVTNGRQFVRENNQPVIKNSLVAVHNGIITNNERLWDEHPELNREYDVDTEILLELINKYASSGISVPEALGNCFTKIEGTASVAVFSKDFKELILATNNGSLYYRRDSETGCVVFASENYILEQFVRKTQRTGGGGGCGKNRKLKAKTMLLIDTELSTLTLRDLLPGQSFTSMTPRKSKLVLNDFSRREEDARNSIRRCMRCILPETMPFISFDEEGVCNYCRDYQKDSTAGLDALRAQVEPFRSKDGTPDCIVMFSGGRDSSYGLHIIKKELELNPLVYTYDWGVITDLGRRNQARLCGKLGVEHVIVSADISRKRRYVRKNIDAWLHRPSLGMIPIFMAGDKQYYYYANQLRKCNDIPLVFVCECPLELTKFKAGFCGVKESNNRIFDISFFKKIKLINYYAMQYFRNPGYFNGSFLDNIFAFWSSYFMKHDYTFLYRYVPWNEEKINDVLINEYGWEVESNYNCTWRIGDGTAAFYNYIYHTVAGFTENETLRSNQIREGVLTREEAMKRVDEENRPRWDSMEWYAQTIGFNLSEALRVINNMPKLYVKGKLG